MSPIAKYDANAEPLHALLNKVPQITFFFWVIKIMATTVGETAADFLATTLKIGLRNTTYLMSVLLIGALVYQFRQKRYIPWIYWLAVVLISVVGTMITDTLVDKLGVPLTTTTAIFGAALAATFAVWYASERTLSIHTIVTTRREVFYWLAILFTFALGTAAGDLLAEGLKLGYTRSAVLFAGLIGVVTLGYYVFRLNAVLAFWVAYILTRPLGASMGDLLSQPIANGGLGLGTLVTSGIFLTIIAALVAYFTLTKADVIEASKANAASKAAT